MTMCEAFGITTILAPSMAFAITNAVDGGVLRSCSPTKMRVGHLISLSRSCVSKLAMISQMAAWIAGSSASNVLEIRSMISGRRTLVSDVNHRSMVDCRIADIPPARVASARFLMLSRTASGKDDAVAISVSERTRSGRARTKAWASIPPKEIPAR